ncbi:MAG TPA: alanine racemase [Candidatus Saccharimonadales bacterium]|nr:alanine racemase [Candidatus Saccharimonadales bacterium]
MIPTKLERIAHEARGRLQGLPEQVTIERVCADSRGAAPGSLFVALQGLHTDGHAFLAAAFHNGASAAMVSQTALAELGAEWNSRWPLVVVPDPLRGLQALARWHRRECFGKVVAITGSNGKTIVKDVLKMLLAGRRVLASPGSYNSQLGLPLSVLSAEQPEDIAILEVGISAPGEMVALEEIAAPDYGILTNIGMAHFAAFGSREAIAREKMSLFQRIGKDGWLLVPSGEPAIEGPAAGLQCQIYRVGRSDAGAAMPGISLTSVSLIENGCLLELTTGPANRKTAMVKTRSPEIIADLHLAAVAAHLLGVEPEEIAAALDGYAPTSTRMELWSSPQGIHIINDSYSSDPISVHAALRSAAQSAPAGGRCIFAFAGMRELGANSNREHRQVGEQAGACGVSHLFLVGGGDLESTAEGYKATQPGGSLVHVANAEDLKTRLLPMLRPGDTVLFKGPRNAGMVKAVQDLSGAIAQRCLWVNLAAIEGNIARFRRHCGAGTNILAMLKAMAYGTELTQLASWMSRLSIRHVGVSSANEGVAVRKTGAEQEILVFLCDREDIDNLLHYRLTPVIYSAELVEAFARSLAGSPRRLDVHLKVDTGMHRLGVASKTALDLAQRIARSGVMRLTGICTHFAAAEDPAQDGFTRQQIAEFNEVLGALQGAGFDGLQIHAANTAAAARFPDAHYNMVRVGLGLYGLFPSEAAEQALELELAVGVTSRITSIQEFPPGATLGYNRTYTAQRALRVGIVPFGYDDGLPWALAGKGEVLVEGRRAPIVGRISMDQMQVDVTDLPGIQSGAEVLLYGTHNGHTLRPEEVAQKAGTISHELLTRLGDRVHRIYVEP